ncbi:hypothetical protein CLU94_4723 [Janthinobacterium sp. 13]|nr:hypothetical protein CLU94_4723 [Janthinobacterium sp. 13]
MNQSNMNEGKERLDAWYDGSAICLIAVGAQRVRSCCDGRLTAQAAASAFSIAMLARLMPLGWAYASSRKEINPAAR